MLWHFWLLIWGGFLNVLLSTRLIMWIAILTVYKQVFWYLNFAKHRTKESFVSTANKPLVGTLMTIGDVTVSIAIGHRREIRKLTFRALALLRSERRRGNARNVSFRILALRWPIHIINPDDKTKLSCWEKASFHN